jgi:hypothetical protein
MAISKSIGDGTDSLQFNPNTTTEKGKGTGGKRKRAKVKSQDVMKQGMEVM